MPEPRDPSCAHSMPAQKASDLLPLLYKAHQASAARGVDEALHALTGRLRDNYPFFHPDYAGQMLKPPHPVAAAGYLAAMLVNPNNHALEGGPATAELEREVMQELAAMFHMTEPTLGHLTSGGTMANLEALFVARELHPSKA